MSLESGIQTISVPSRPTIPSASRNRINSRPQRRRQIRNTPLRILTRAGNRIDQLSDRGIELPRPNPPPKPTTHTGPPSRNRVHGRPQRGGEVGDAVRRILAGPRDGVDELAQREAELAFVLVVVVVGAARDGVDGGAEGGGQVGDAVGGVFARPGDGVHEFAEGGVELRGGGGGGEGGGEEEEGDGGEVHFGVGVMRDGWFCFGEVFLGEDLLCRRL